MLAEVPPGERNVWPQSRAPPLWLMLTVIMLTKRPESVMPATHLQMETLRCPGISNLHSLKVAEWGPSPGFELKSFCYRPRVMTSLKKGTSLSWAMPQFPHLLSGAVVACACYFSLGADTKYQTPQIKEGFVHSVWRFQSISAGSKAGRPWQSSSCLRWQNSAEAPRETGRFHSSYPDYWD